MRGQENLSSPSFHLSRRCRHPPSLSSVFFYLWWGVGGRDQGCSAKMTPLTRVHWIPLISAPAPMVSVSFKLHVSEGTLLARSQPWWELFPPWKLALSDKPTPPTPSQSWLLNITQVASASNPPNSGQSQHLKYGMLTMFLLSAFRGQLWGLRKDHTIITSIMCYKRCFNEQFFFYLTCPFEWLFPLAKFLEMEMLNPRVHLVYSFRCIWCNCPSEKRYQFPLPSPACLAIRYPRHN